MGRVIDWFHFTRIRLRIMKVSLAVVLSAGVAGVFLASSRVFDERGGDRRRVDGAVGGDRAGQVARSEKAASEDAASAPVQAGDSEEVVVETEVKDWDTILGSDRTKRDAEINVVGDRVLLFVHDRFIVRLRVTRVVRGKFEYDAVRLLTHSPAQDGVKRAGQKFVLRLKRRSTLPTVMASDREELSRGFSHFTFAKTLYKVESVYPAWARWR
jgi:hypothetical protein